MRVTATFKGTDIGRLLIISEIDRSNQKAIVIKGTVLDDKRVAVQKQHRELKRLLLGRSYGELVFSDEPDVMYYARVADDGYDSDADTPWAQQVVITFEVKNGIAWSTGYKEVSPSAIRKGSRTITIDFDNQGTTDALPIFEITASGQENGFYSIATAKSIYEIGNVEEINSYATSKNQTIIAKENFRNVLAGGSFSSRSTNDPADKTQGRLALGSLTGTSAMVLSNRGTEAGRNGGTWTYTVPGSAPRNTSGTISGHLYWRECFENSVNNQMGTIKVLVFDNNTFLYGHEITKNTIGNSATVKFWIGNNAVNEFTFDSFHTNNNNPFKKEHCHNAMYREDDQVKFFHGGKYYDYQDSMLKGKNETHIVFYMAGVTGVDLPTGFGIWDIEYIRYRTLHIVDVPNRFAQGSTLLVDSEEKKTRLNGMLQNELVWGSEYPTVPPGRSQAIMTFSSWLSRLPDVKVRYRERWK